MAVPARQFITLVVQDNRGFRSRLVINAFTPDMTAFGATVTDEFNAVAAVGAAVQAMTNAKVIETAFGYRFDIAQEPSTETGTYQLVQQGAHLIFGDGTVSKEFITIPAPSDDLFLTSGSENLVVVNPASPKLANLQAATTQFWTAGGGRVFAQFFGGQLRGGKPRRRRVLQGA